MRLDANIMESKVEAFVFQAVSFLLGEKIVGILFIFFNQKKRSFKHHKTI